MKKLIIKLAVLFAFLMVLTGSFSLNNPSPVSAHTAQATHAQQAFNVQCNNYDAGRFGFGYYARLSGQFCYDGSNVWITRVDCSYVYYGASISQTYCGVTHSGVYGEVGSNYQVSILYNGFPISWPGYARLQFGPRGEIFNVQGNG